MAQKSKPKSRAVNNSASTPLIHNNVAITGIAYGGDGIARLDGQVIFVRDALPGDHADLLVYEQKKNFARARVQQLVQPSPARRTAPCPWSASCGGCQWQDAHYEAQLTWKRQFITDALQRIGQLETIPPITVHGSQQEFFYRNRVQLKYQGGRWGFYGANSHQLVAISRCQIADPVINEAIEQLLKVDVKSLPPCFLEIQVTGTQWTGVISADRPQVAKAATTYLQERGLPVLTEAACASSPYFLYDEQDGVQFFSQPNLFQQVNIPLNQQVRARITATLMQHGVRQLLDLFCGSGNLSLLPAKAGIKVHGVEIDRAAIACAQYNVKQNALTAVRYTALASHQYLTAVEQQQFNAVIVDPPRAGLEQAVDSLIALNAPLIIYLSCDPNTLARDLRTLLAAGYHLQSVEGFDFFPQTYHIETLAILAR